MVDNNNSSLKKTKTAKSARTRQNILDAACNLIDERGCADFQMMEVAKRCNMSKGALYYYFEDREELVEEILSTRLDNFVDDLERGMKLSDNAEGALHSLCMAFAQTVSSQDSIIPTIAMELVRGGRDTLERVNARFKRINDLIEQQIELGKEEGLVRPEVDSKFLSNCISGTFFFAAFNNSSINGQKLDGIKLADELMDYIAHGIATY